MDQVQQGTAILLDVNPPHTYSKAHPAGSYNFPFHRRQWGHDVKRALQGQNPPIGIFAENTVVADAAKNSLLEAGLSVPFVFDQGVKGWEEAGLPVARVHDLTVDELAQNLENYIVVDVREPYELRSGIIPGAISIPMGQLQQRIAELDKSRAHAIVCASGSRSASVAAWLSQQGFNVANVVGGMSLWMGARHPVQRA
ncbi:MAG: sulfurtransferase [Sulfobacillus benefaciens]|uniref:Sulfurtransferase n=1 Tax=Sulfobacillus benefaciens TaxID=453960 RepID=A0A2T2XCZ9_9FIRM|nr:MAG: sulfurtransferase [Sulfobacillus benefaciens]